MSTWATLGNPHKNPRGEGLSVPRLGTSIREASSLHPPPPPHSERSGGWSSKGWVSSDLPGDLHLTASQLPVGGVWAVTTLRPHTQAALWPQCSLQWTNKGQSQSGEKLLATRSPRGQGLDRLLNHSSASHPQTSQSQGPSGEEATARASLPAVSVVNLGRRMGMFVKPPSSPRHTHTCTRVHTCTCMG